MPDQLLPEALALWIREGRTFELLDVRENDERERCSLGGKHIPLSEFQSRIGELNPALPIVVYCHHGERSFFVCRLLNLVHGFQQVYNLSGGIDRWAIEMDPHLPRY